MNINDFFGEHGPLAKSMPGYRARDQQVEVSNAIDHTFNNGGVLIAEAPTGSGKSLAGLVPAAFQAMKGKRTIYSTHTTALQSQLNHKDIPLLVKLFNDSRVSGHVMKGRSHYVCNAAAFGASVDMGNSSDNEIRLFDEWTRNTSNGDRDDLPFNFARWKEMTSTSEGCRGSSCSFYHNCFYYRMRWASDEHLIIVVNHSLLLTDAKIRESNPEAAILPEYDHLIIDEAHSLQEVASQAFSIELSTRDILSMIATVERGKIKIHSKKLRSIEKIMEGLYDPFVKMAATELRLKHHLKNGFMELEYQQTLKSLVDAILNVTDDFSNHIEDPEVAAVARQCEAIRQKVEDISLSEEPERIVWASRQGNHATLTSTPLTVNDLLEKYLWKPVTDNGGGAVLISATLTTSADEEKKFRFHKKSLGLPDDTVELQTSSPFDYKNRTLLYVPKDTPVPPFANDPSYEAMFARQTKLLAEMVSGGIMILFTSRRMMDTMWNLLKGEFDDRPLFKQGEDQSIGASIKSFREAGNGILFGLSSLWTGVDIAGSALECIIIEKIPFQPHTSPVTEARLDHLKSTGGNAFMEHSIPVAIMTLRQGAGRLMRSEDDRGMIVIMDSRLHNTRYGPGIVRALPPSKKVRTITEAREWYESMD